MSIGDLLWGSVFFGWGLWCFIAAFRKKKVQALILSSDEFLPRKILGPYFDVIMNVIIGTACILFAVILVFK